MIKLGMNKLTKEKKLLGGLGGAALGGIVDKDSRIKGALTGGAIGGLGGTVLDQNRELEDARTKIDDVRRTKEGLETYIDSGYLDEITPMKNWNQLKTIPKSLEYDLSPIEEKRKLYNEYAEKYNLEKW